MLLFRTFFVLSWRGVFFFIRHDDAMTDKVFGTHRKYSNLMDTKKWLLYTLAISFSILTPHASEIYLLLLLVTQCTLSNKIPEIFQLKLNGLCDCQVLNLVRQILWKKKKGQ